MISLDECRKYLGESAIDHEVEYLRSHIYTFVEQVLDFLINSGTLARQENEEGSPERD